MNQDIIACINAKTEISSLQEVIKHICDYYRSWKTYPSISLKDAINSRLCWALPSRESLDFISSNFRQYSATHPGARLIDMGSGTGLWTLLLRECDLPVVAVDLPMESRWCYDNMFVEPISDYVQGPDDVLLMTWGCDCRPIDDFIKGGGKAMIIQGEDYGGCTVPYTYNPAGWPCLADIPGRLPSMASPYAEGIAFYVSDK